MAKKAYVFDGSAWQDLASSLTDLSNAVPTGVVMPFAGTSAPNNYLMCYGQAVSRTTYANLFATLGTTYGSGDGSTTFNLPDMRGRVPAGKDNMGGSSASRLTSGITGGIGNGTTLGSTGGEQAHTQTIAEMPSHNHTADGNLIPRGTGTVFRELTDPGTGSSNPNTRNTGGGNAFNVLQPTMILNYIIKI